MNICRLKPEFVEPLSLALFEEWHDFAPWSSMDKIRAYYAQCLDGDDLPLAFAAVDKEGRLMGSAALKRFDMACFPEYEYWLGDVFVLPQFRGLGVAGSWFRFVWIKHANWVCRICISIQPLLLLLLRSLLLCSADWSVMSLSAIRPVPALPETSDPVMLILDCSPAPPAIRVVLPPA